MSQGFATAFYHDVRWLKNRKAYLMKPIETPMGTIPPGMCERCFERGELVPARVVHHKIHLTPENINDPHITLNFSNFQRLCQDCHAEVHSGRQPSRVTYNPDGTISPNGNNSLEAMVMHLTETADERRNIHSLRTR